MMSQWLAGDATAAKGVEVHREQHTTTRRTAASPVRSGPPRRVAQAADTQRWSGGLRVTWGGRASLAKMTQVFVYGTLKRGQPNHPVMLDGTNGSAAFRGRGRTVEPYPLVIAGQYNIPFLLDLPGRGHCVAGEIYAVDDQMLQFLDEFEGCPDMYQRTLVQIEVLEWEGLSGVPKKSPAADTTVRCFMYSTTTYSPEWLHLPYHDDYDSQGTHGLRYKPHR